MASFCKWDTVSDRDGTGARALACRARDLDMRFEGIDLEQNRTDLFAEPPFKTFKKYIAPRRVSGMWARSE